MYKSKETDEDFAPVQIIMRYEKLKTEQFIGAIEWLYIE